MRIRTALAASVLAVLASGAHAATVLATAPADASYPNTQTLYCDVVNKGTKPVTVTIEAIEYDGTVDATLAAAVLAPATGTFLQGGGTSAWCRFTVISGSAHNLRAMGVYDNGTNYVLSVPAQ